MRVLNNLVNKNRVKFVQNLQSLSDLRVLNDSEFINFSDYKLSLLDPFSVPGRFPPRMEIHSNLYRLPILNFLGYIDFSLIINCNTKLPE